MSNKFLVVDPVEQLDVIKGLASEVRIRIIRLLESRGPLNVNQIAELLGLPQSTVSSNIQILEKINLVVTRSEKARKGS